jgi:hypothetical protein
MMKEDEGPTRILSKPMELRAPSMRAVLAVASSTSVVNMAGTVNF